ncbi:MAG TPA: tyrosine-type recombinase/integrase, partial [Acetobacteraceae bacterium]|nr:tyrosine-type recombinase/integrase [Acetobacteraceae bacterium]
MADGKDPVGERRERRATARARAGLPTVAERLTIWQAANEARWSRRYASEVGRLCSRELLPALGDRPLTEVTRELWTSLLAATARRSPSVGAMLYRTVAAFLSHADAHGWITEHPLPRRGAAKIAPPVPSRERVLSDDELRRVWVATATLGPGSQCFVRLLIATGCRAGEAAGIALGELDPASGLWRLSAQRTKNNRPHVMPVPPALMVELMARAPEGAGAGYRLLGRTRGGALSGFSKIKVAIDTSSGVSGWRFHDVRRTVRTRLA